MFSKMINKIKEYSIICIYRHINEDYDALGSQFGLKKIIEDSFPEKKVYALGSIQKDLSEKMQIENINNVEIDYKSSLAIILDTANSLRIDGSTYQLSDYKIKVDHHIVIESYGDLNIEDPDISSCSELITLFYQLNKNELILSKEAAKYLYYGILGDTNRFFYKNSNAQTLRLAATLLETGFDKDQVHQRFYIKKKGHLEILQYILNHYQIKGSIAYYVLSQNDLDKLSIERQVASGYVNCLSDIEEFKVWISITENKEEKNWRVSIRSREVPINDIASKYNGGGHALASGATLKYIEDLNQLIEDLNSRISQYHYDK
jgi:Exopolyphosphatase-related proteins